jgi:hypothetical protein
VAISHVYRGIEVIARNPFEHEVPSLGATYPDEGSAHRAINAMLADWLEGYDRVGGTPSVPVDDTR